MDILERLNSGQLHATARKRRPDCVDQHGNVHRSPERRLFVDFSIDTKRDHGDDHELWPDAVRAEYHRLFEASL